MAGKTRGNDSGGGGQSNRFRFVMIEGELSEGTMGAFAQAITTALKSATPPAVAPRVQGRAAPALGAANGNASGADADVEGEEIAVVEDEGDEAPAPNARGARKTPSQPRTYYKPKVLNDVDFSVGDPPFEYFFKSKGSPAETSRRFLTIAAWFAEHAREPVTQITADHVYTGYRAMGWTLDMKDVGKPFRDLKGQGWGEYKDRKFEIGRIGLNVVKKMTAEGSSDSA